VKWLVEASHGLVSNEGIGVTYRTQILVRSVWLCCDVVSTALERRLQVRHNGIGLGTMANLTIEMPDDLARSLEGLAATQHKTIQELAVEGLRSLVTERSEPLRGSAAAVSRAMREPPHPSASDVDDLDAAIAAGRLPVRTRDLFPR
jgi:hypothetical protein